MDYLIGIDIGTTGAKTVLCEPTGEVVSTAFVQYPLYHPQPNWAEQDPEDWCIAAKESISSVLSQAGINGSVVRGISLSGQMHGAVFLDKSYSVLRPAILWCDVRTSEQCRWITEEVGTAKLVGTACNPALEGFTLPKIIWVRDNEPEIYAKTAKVLLPKDYVRFRLTGEIASEVSDAAGTLLFDVKARKWSEELLRCLDISRNLLPECFESIDICGEITTDVAAQTGLKPGTPVVAGGADNTCGAVGAGIVKPGRASSSIGSSGVLFAHTDEAKIDTGLRVHTFNHSVPGKWYVMGVMLAAGLSFRWFKENLCQPEKEVERLTGIDSYELMTSAAATVSAGSEGLVFLPYLNGERTPHGDANAKGVFFGLTLRHTKAHMIRAIMEGVVFGLRDSLEIIKKMGVEVQEIRAIGGGAKSSFWRQIQADVMAHELVTINVTEGPAYGAALLAGVGTGIYKSVEEATDATIKVVSRTEPDSNRSRKYKELYQVYKSLYPALKPDFDRISSFVLYES